MSAPVNLRPIEAMGVGNVIEALGLSELGPVTKLAERKPWPVPGGLDVLPRFVGPHFVLADPLAVYVFSRVDHPKLDDLALSVGIWSPTGQTIDDGFLVQRFLVHFDEGKLRAYPQEPLMHTRADLDASLITLTTEEGESRVAADLSAEVPHAIAGLHYAVKGRAS